MASQNRQRNRAANTDPKGPQKGSEQIKTNPDKNKGAEHTLYSKWKPRAERIKIILQMWIGALLVFFLVTKFVFHLFSISYHWSEWLKYLEYIHSLGTLLIVSYALAYSAGIELAYMLFTPGPDEAIAPLVTSAAAGLMHAIANEGGLNTQTVFSMLIYVIVIASLFMIKEIFTKDENEERRLIDYLRTKLNQGNDRQI